MKNSADPECAFSRGRVDNTRAQAVDEGRGLAGGGQGSGESRAGTETLGVPAGAGVLRGQERSC